MIGTDESAQIPANSGATTLKKHKMSLLSVFLLIFCLVSGGYFGIEDMVSASGPGLTILILLLFPLFWSIPQALIASELGSAIPEEGGYYKWVQRAFGEFWGFQVGWWRTLSCYVDSTLYVVLSVGYISAFVDLTGWQGYLLKAIIILVFTWINYRGIQEVGRITTILMLFVLATLVIFIILGAINWQYNPVLPFIPEGQTVFSSLGLGTAIAIWIYSGYESMGTMAGELENPQIIPKATLLTIPAVIAVYVLPIIFGMASYGNYAEWSADTGVSFVTIAASYGIPGLAFIFTLGAVACNLSLYNSYLASSSRGFFVIAEDRLSPPILCKVNKKHGTPHIAILSMTVINLILVQFGFATLVVIDVILFMFAYLIWFLAAIALRVQEPDLPRPFKIPFGVKGMILMTIAPAIICVTAFFTNGTSYLIGGSIGLLSGPIAYIIFKKRYGGLDQTKKISPRTRSHAVLLSVTILLSLGIGVFLLVNTAKDATASFDGLYDTYLAESYERLGESYDFEQDSFVLRLDEKSIDNDTSLVWYYQDEISGDFYLGNAYADEAAFAQDAYIVYQKTVGADEGEYFSYISVYSDAYEFYAEAGDLYANPDEIYESLTAN